MPIATSTRTTRGGASAPGCIGDSETENLWVTARQVLNDEVYAAMWLRYAEDMSVNDISMALDRSVSWTKVNLLRGRRALDARMNEGSKESEAGILVGE